MFVKNLQYLSILIAAVILGNWYLSEYRKARMAGKPWHQTYFSLPGILIVVLILILPFIARFI